MADDITIKITATTDELQASMQQAKASVENFSSAGGQLQITADVMAAALQRVGNNTRKLTEELLQTIAAEKAGGGSAAQATKETAALGEASQKTGTATKALGDELKKKVVEEKNEATAAKQASQETANLGTVSKTASQTTKDLGESARSAGSSAKGLGGELKDADDKAKTFHGSTSVLTRELLVLGREASLGNFSRMAGSFTILATSGLGLSMALLGVIGVVGGVAAGLGYLAVRAIETSEAIDKIQMKEKLVNDLDMSREAINQLAQSLSDLSSKSFSESMKAAENLAGVYGLTGDKLELVKNQLVVLSTATGQNLDKTAEMVAKELEAGVSAEQLAQKYHVEATALGDMARKADDSKNANEQLRVKILILQSQVDKMAESVAKNKEQMVGADISTYNWFMRLVMLVGQAELASQGATDLGNATDEAGKKALQAASAANALATALQNESAAARTAADAQRDLASAMSLTGDSPTRKIAAAHSQIETLNKGLEVSKTRLAELEKTGGPEKAIDTARQNVKEMEEEITHLQKTINDLNFSKIQDDAERSNAKLEADGGKTTAILKSQLDTLLEARKKMLTAQEGDEEATGHHLIAIDRQIAALRERIAHQGKGNALAATKEGLSEINALEATDNIERLKQQVEYLKQRIANIKEGTKEELALLTMLHNKEAELARALKKEDIGEARERTQTKLAIMQSEFTETKAILDDEVAAHKMTVKEEYSQLKTLADQEYQLQIDLYHKELDVANLTRLEKLKLNDDIEKAQAAHAAKMAVLARQEALAQKKEAEEAARYWKDALHGIEDAASSEIGSLLKGQETYAEAARNIAEKLVEDELKADAKWLVQHTLYKLLGIAADEKGATGGLLVHLFAEAKETAATATGTATRSALKVGESLKDAAGKTIQVGAQVAAEAGKTGAAAAGSASRTGIAASEGGGVIGWIIRTVGQFFFGETAKTTVAGTEAAARAALTVAPNVAQIASYAATGAAAAYASTAAIPIVGPGLAPEVAAATYAAIMAFAPAATAERGWGKVPKTTVTELHKDEMVLPASLASPMRSMLTASPPMQNTANDNSSTNNQNLNVTFQIHAIDTQSGAAFLKSNAHHIVSSIKAQMRNGVKFA